MLEQSNANQILRYHFHAVLFILWSNWESEKKCNFITAARKNIMFSFIKIS